MNQGDRPLLIDVTRLIGRARKKRMPTGVDRVCLAYIAFFHHRAQALVQHGAIAVALSPTASSALFAWLLAWRDGQPHPALGTTMAWLARLPLRAVPMGSWVLNMGHSGLDRRGYGAWMVRKRIRLLVMAHDLIPLTHPQFCRPGEDGRHAARVRVILRHAAGIVSNSQHTARVLRHYAQQWGVTLPPISVIPLGANHFHHAPLPAIHDPLPASYFLMVGTIEPRKNHQFALDLWREWKSRRTDVPLLVVIGQVGWMCGDIQEQFREDAALKDSVRVLHHCGNDCLRAYLQGARALLFPSHEEGYGLPLVEALAVGIPVIASPLPVFREIAGDVPDYIETSDASAWLAALSDYSRPDSPMRQGQLERLRHFSPPTWEQHFEQFTEFMNRL